MEEPAKVLASHTEQWQRLLWGVAAVALIGAFSALLWFSLDLLNRMNDMVDQVTKATSATNPRDNFTFLFSAIGLTHSTLLRLMGIFTGTAVCFAGLMISFFTHAKETRLSLASGAGDDGARAGLATYSPGIVAIVVGAAIVVASLYDKSSFNYTGAAGEGSTEPPAVAPPHKLPPPDAAKKLLEGEDATPAPNAGDAPAIPAPGPGAGKFTTKPAPTKPAAPACAKGNKSCPSSAP